ncbi:MAG: tetratricopeptide repeat protein [Planctomycetia bacterium]|nr:tetratricopeptide repeat protein [Planctomycetia bacterium]
MVRRTLNVRLLSITLVIVSLVGIGSYFWRAYQVSRTASALLERADALEKEGDFGSAINYRRRYLQFHPEDDDEFVRLAETLDEGPERSANKTREAISIYLGALGLKGVSPDRKSELGVRAAELYLDLKDYPAAREQAEKLLGIKKLPPEEELTVNENNPRARRVLALALYGLHQRDDLKAVPGTGPVIVEELKRALDLNPDDIQLATVLAGVYREESNLLSKEEREKLGQGDREKRADDIIRQMVANAESAESAKSAKSAEAHAAACADARFAGYRYKTRYGLAGADKDLDEALRLKPDDPYLLVTAGYTRGQAGFVDQARTLCSRAIEVAPTNPSPYLGLARVCLAEGRSDEAVAVCRRGLAKVPGEDVRRLSLFGLIAEIQINVYQQRWGEPREGLTEAETKDRERDHQNVEKATADQADAIRDLRPVISGILERQPDAPVRGVSVTERAHDLLRGRWLAIKGESKEAVKLLEHVAMSRGDSPEEVAQSVQAFGLLGAMHAREGNWKQAVAAFERATSLQPTSVPLLLAAGDACIKAQLSDQGISYCRRAVALQDSPVTRFALAKALVQQEADKKDGERNGKRLEDSLAEVGSFVLLVESAAAAAPARAALAELEQSLKTVEGEETGCYWRYCRARRLLAESAKNDDAGFREAVQLASAIEKMRPDWPATSLLRGYVREREGLPEEAAEAYKNALKAKAPKTLVYERLFPLLSQMGRFKELDGYVSQSRDQIVASPTLAPLAILREAARGNNEGAMELARRCVEVRPSEPADRIRLGQVLLGRGDAEQAETEFKQAVSLARGGRERAAALDALFRFYAQSKQLESAQATLRELSSDKSQTESQRSLVSAKGAEVLGNRDQAEAHYRKAAELSPDDDAVQMELVKFLGRTNDPAKLPEAETLLRKLVARSPKFGPARQGLAILLAGRGGEKQWEESQQLLSEAVAGADSSSGDQRLEALLLARRGGKENRQRAREVFEKLLADSEKPIAGDRVALARLCEQDGLTEAADKHLRAIVEAEPSSPSHLASYVEFLLRHGDAEAAAPWVAKLKEMTPDSLATLSQIARWLFARNEASQIEPAVEPVAERLMARSDDPRDKALVALTVGNLYRSVEQDDAAQRWYQRMVAVPEPDGQHLVGFVSFLLDRGKADQAAEWLKKLEEKAPDDLDTVALRARWLEARGEGKQIEALVEPVAASLVAKCDKDRQREARAALAVGNLYSSVGLHQVAARWYQRVRELDDSVYQPLAISLARQGRPAEAVRLCVDAAKADQSLQPALTVASALTAGKPGKDDHALAEPILALALQQHKDDATLLAAVATVRLVQGRTEEAIAMFKDVLRLAPNDVVALNNLASILGDLPDRRAEALETVERAIRIAGPRPNLLDTKGTILARDGKAAQARPLLEKAVSTSRSDPRYHLHLAEAYLQLGEREKAKASFSRARDTNLTSQILTPSDEKAIEELQKTMVP